MVISTQVSLDSSKKSLNLSSKNSNSLSVSITNKTSKEVSSLVDKSKSNSKASDKTDDFKKIIDSKTYSDSKKTNKVDNSKDGISKEDIKDKFENIKEEIEENTDDEKAVDKLIESLLGIINNLLGVTDKDVNMENNQVDMLLDDSSKVLDTSSLLLNQLLETLNSEEAKTGLDSEILSGMKDLLSDFVSQLSENVKIKDNVKDNISNIISKLSDMIEDSQANNGKVLSLEEMLNNSQSKNQDSSLNGSDSQSNETIKNSNENSKEDKFLSSLLEDKNDNSIDNKINMFASRTQHVQGQNTENRGLSVNKVTFTNDVIKDVKYMVTNNIKELSVKVNPGNLGEITIRLVQEDGLMKANLKANSKETTTLLLQNIAEIKKELSEQNMKISEVNIELYNDDTTYFKNGSFGGTLSEGQERNKNKEGSSNITTGTLNIEQDEEAIDNNAKIDNALDFLA